MEGKLLLQHKSPMTMTGTRACTQYIQRKKCSPAIIAVLARPAGSIAKTMDRASGYKDSWFDKMAINHLSQSVQAITGLRNEKSGYESLVEATKEVWRNFEPIDGREFVIRALEVAFPRPVLSIIRTILPQSKLAREYFAAFTTLFFTWLVGPCEVRESEFNGRREKNVVHITKCRFLEESNCVGMCVNLCKVPSQRFIKDSLGMPVNMVPDFGDMSCDMIFGQDPPAPSDDPALKQPCYNLCKAKQRHVATCSG